jgi:NADH-quinone oxidoreductase subunit L
VHESPRVMTVPLIILAIGAVFAGFLGVPHIPGVPEQLHAFANYLEPVFKGAEAGAAQGAAHTGEHPINWLLLGAGALIGWGGWIFGRSLGLNATRALDRLYNATVVRAGFAFAAALLWFDENVVDGIVNGTGYVVQQIGTSLRLMQTSYVRSYALAMVLGAVVVIAYFLTQSS